MDHLDLDAVEVVSSGRLKMICDDNAMASLVRSIKKFSLYVLFPISSYLHLRPSPSRYFTQFSNPLFSLYFPYVLLVYHSRLYSSDLDTNFENSFIFNLLQLCRTHSRLRIISRYASRNSGNFNIVGAKGFAKKVWESALDQAAGSDDLRRVGCCFSEFIVRWQLHVGLCTGDDRGAAKRHANRCHLQWLLYSADWI